MTATPAVPRYLSVTMPDFRRSHLPQDLPHWINPAQEAFFITINCRPRGRNQLAKAEVWHEILESIQFREERGEWNWRLVLAMPDHLHGIVTWPNHFDPRKSMSTWKRWLAGKLKTQWQDGYFDHRLRSVESAGEKAEYIRMNPVRAGLANTPAEWPYKKDWKSNV
ncbi:MAG: hypothetical protein ABI600_19005 [Luteolibacter sp.]